MIGAGGRDGNGCANPGAGAYLPRITAILELIGSRTWRAIRIYRSRVDTRVGGIVTVSAITLAGELTRVTGGAALGITTASD